MAVVNIPMTFPAETVNGVMVSGMDAPRLDTRAVHPPELLGRLRSISPDYRIMSKAAHAAETGDAEAAERELLDVLRARARAVQGLAATRDLDLVVANLEATDGAHHFFWQHHDPGHPRHDPRAARGFGDTIGRVYQETDRHLGALIDAYDPDTVFVVSDHGGGPSNDWVFFLNDWLMAEGFLTVRPTMMASTGQRLYAQAKRRLSVPARRSLRPLFGKVLERAKGAALYGDLDWSRSSAYAHMQPAVRLNLLGREPAGSVPLSGRDETISRLVDRAGGLRLPTGEPLVLQAHPASEVYRGDAPGGPDLVLRLTPGIHVRSRNTTGRPGHLHRLSDLGMYLPSGVHTEVGMVAAMGAGVERRGKLEAFDILQVAPSILAVMGVPAGSLDAEPFSFVTRELCVAGPEPPTEPEEGPHLGAEEEAEVLERLRGLGYVD